MKSKGVLGLVVALFLLSLGGLMLHIRIHLIHVPEEPLFYLIPVAFGAITTFVLPFLFCSSKTVAWAYLINWLAVLVGTVGMAYWTWGHWEGQVTVYRVIFESTLADIIILWSKIPLGHMILRQHRPKK